MPKLKDGFRGSRAIILPESIVRDMEQDPFESKLHITDIGYYPKAKHHFRARENGVSQYILIYCIDGKGWVECCGQRHEVGPNTFFIIPAGQAHSYGSDVNHPWTIYWLHFKGEVASIYGNGHNLPTGIAPGDHSRIAQRLAIFEEIFTTLENGYSRENIDFAISSLYYFLGSIRFIGKFRESSTRQEHSKDTIDRAVKYMRENIEKSLSLEDMCQYLGYSASYFSGMFKRNTGYSPIQYFIQIKMQAACNMLDFTDMKINQICHKTGISDPYYFTKLFTKTIGMSPSRYREIKKG